MATKQGSQVSESAAKAAIEAKNKAASDQSSGGTARSASRSVSKQGSSVSQEVANAAIAAKLGGGDGGGRSVSRSPAKVGSSVSPAVANAAIAAKSGDAGPGSVGRRFAQQSVASFGGVVPPGVSIFPSDASGLVPGYERSPSQTPSQIAETYLYGGPSVGIYGSPGPEAPGPEAPQSIAEQYLAPPSALERLMGVTPLGFPAASIPAPPPAPPATVAPIAPPGPFQGPEAGLGFDLAPLPGRPPFVDPGFGLESQPIGFGGTVGQNIANLGLPESVYFGAGDLAPPPGPGLELLDAAGNVVGEYRGEQVSPVGIESAPMNEVIYVEDPRYFTLPPLPPAPITQGAARLMDDTLGALEFDETMLGMNLSDLPTLPGPLGGDLPGLPVPPGVAQAGSIPVVDRAPAPPAAQFLPPPVVPRASDRAPFPTTETVARVLGGTLGGRQFAGTMAGMDVVDGVSAPGALGAVPDRGFSALSVPQAGGIPVADRVSAPPAAQFQTAPSVVLPDRSFMGPDTMSDRASIAERFAGQVPVSAAPAPVPGVDFAVPSLGASDLAMAGAVPGGFAPRDDRVAVSVPGSDVRLAGQGIASLPVVDRTAPAAPVRAAAQQAVPGLGAFPGGPGSFGGAVPPGFDEALSIDAFGASPFGLIPEASVVPVADRVPAPPASQFMPAPAPAEEDPLAGFGFEERPDVIGETDLSRGTGLGGMGLEASSGSSLAPTPANIAADAAAGQRGIAEGSFAPVIGGPSIGAQLAAAGINAVNPLLRGRDRGGEGGFLGRITGGRPLFGEDGIIPPSDPFTIDDFTAAQAEMEDGRGAQRRRFSGSGGSFGSSIRDLFDRESSGRGGAGRSDAAPLGQYGAIEYVGRPAVTLPSGYSMSIDDYLALLGQMPGGPRSANPGLLTVTPLNLGIGSLT